MGTLALGAGEAVLFARLGSGTWPCSRAFPIGQSESSDCSLRLLEMRPPGADAPPPPGLCHSSSLAPSGFQIPHLTRTCIPRGKRNGLFFLKVKPFSSHHYVYQRVVSRFQAPPTDDPRPLPRDDAAPPRGRIPEHPAPASLCGIRSRLCLDYTYIFRNKTR